MKEHAIIKVRQLLEARTDPRLSRLLKKANTHPGDTKTIEALFNVAKRAGLSLYATVTDKQSPCGLFRGVFRIEKVGPIPAGQYSPPGQLSYGGPVVPDGRTGFLMTPIARHTTMVRHMDWYIADEFVYLNPKFGVMKSGGSQAASTPWDDGPRTSYS